jgi:hypothetical protein
VGGGGGGAAVRFRAALAAEAAEALRQTQSALVDGAAAGGAGSGLRGLRAALAAAAAGAGGGVAFGGSDAAAAPASSGRGPAVWRLQFSSFPSWNVRATAALSGRVLGTVPSGTEVHASSAPGPFYLGGELLCQNATRLPSRL